jgi:ketosteroid isomerase-like protein
MTQRHANGAESEFLKAFRQAFEEGNRAWNEGDFTRAYGGLPEDIEYDLAPTWPHARPLHGPDDIVAFFQDVPETFPDVRSEVLELIQADERTVIAGLRVIGTGGRSGVGTQMEIWQVWAMRGGVVPVRVREFHDRPSALEAAGAKEPAQREDG